MDLILGLQKIVRVFDAEKIPYMMVGGFATSFYNRYRYTVDIDFVLQIHPFHIQDILKHFPDWLPFLDAFRYNAERGIVFNLTDFESGVKYDFMLYQVSDYNWKAFERRRTVDFMGMECCIAAPEDLIISKLIWYNMSGSSKQWEDLQFLIRLEGLDKSYLELWTLKLFIKRHGLF